MRIGDIVKIEPAFCDIGERDFKYVVLKLNKVTAEILDVDHYIPFVIDRHRLVGGDIE